MALIRWAECKAKVSDKAIACPKCGAPVEFSKKSRRNEISTGRGCLIILLTVIGFVAFYMFTDANDTPTATSPSQHYNQTKVKVYNKDTYAEPQKQATTEVLDRKQEEDITYEIINTYTFRDIKRSLDVRLNKKVSEKTLRAIAFKLKAQDPKNYERTFICYYLPDMKIDAGAWATTHFDPDIEVRILGLTVEQEEALNQLPDDPSRDVIGNWLDETLYMGRRITIFHQNDKIFMESVYYDGSSGKEEIVEKLSGKDRIFRKKERNSFGEFYLVDSQDNLQLWDQEGLISTAKKIGS